MKLHTLIELLQSLDLDPNTEVFLAESDNDYSMENFLGEIDLYLGHNKVDGEKHLVIEAGADVSVSNKRWPRDQRTWIYNEIRP